MDRYEGRSTAAAVSHFPAPHSFQGRSHRPAPGIRGHVPLLGAPRQYLSQKRLHHPGHRQPPSRRQGEQHDRDPPGADIRPHGVGSQVGAIQTPAGGAPLSRVCVPQQGGDHGPPEAGADPGDGGARRVLASSHRM